MHIYLGLFRERRVIPVLMGSAAPSPSAGKHRGHCPCPIPGSAAAAGHSLYPPQSRSPGLSCAFSAQFHPKSCSTFRTAISAFPISDLSITSFCISNLSTTISVPRTGTQLINLSL